MEELIPLESATIDEMNTIFGNEQAKLKSELIFTSDLDSSNNNTLSPEVKSGNEGDDAVHLQNIGRRNVFSFCNSLTENFHTEEVKTDSLANVENASETTPAVQFGGMSVLGDLERQPDAGGAEDGCVSGEVCNSRTDGWMQPVVVLHKVTTNKSIGVLNIGTEEKESCSSLSEQSDDIFIDKPYICSDCGKTFESTRYSSILRHSCIPQNRENPKKQRKNTRKRRNPRERTEKLGKNTRKRRNPRERTEKLGKNTRKRRNSSVTKKSFPSLHGVVRQNEKQKHLKKPFECEDCPAKYSEFSLLKIHTYVHSKEKPYKCSVCKKKSYWVKSSLIDHLKRVHSADDSVLQLIDLDEKPFGCSECGKRFKEKPSLEKHGKTHSTGDCLCGFCTAKFTSEDLLREHRQACQPRGATDAGPSAGEKPYVCFKCEGTYATRGALRTHLRTHSQRRFWCKICAHRYANESKFRRHLEWHAATDWSHKCTICDRNFKLKAHLKRHMLTHSTGRDKFQCPVCRKEFLDANYLKVHARIHKDQKDYPCDTCGKAFRTKTNLTIHKFTHGPPQFECPICNRCFRLKHSLKKHVLRHTSQDKFECSHCAKVFNNQTSLKCHVGTVHSRRQFKCEICLKIYKTKTHLQEHMNVHLRMNDFKCTSCDREFAYRTSLICHMRAKHSVAEPHQCQVCNATFKEKQNLKRHRLMVHGIGILRLYRCKFCEAEFTAHHTYSNHVKREHLLLDALYACEKCDRMFKHLTSLRYHRKTHKD